MKDEDKLQFLPNLEEEINKSVKGSSEQKDNKKQGCTDTFAFWSYDKFPYMLGGSVGHFNGSKAYIPAYQGYFDPLFVLSEESGEQLRNKLSELENNFRREKTKLKLDYLKEIQEILGDHNQKTSSIEDKINRLE